MTRGQGSDLLPLNREINRTLREIKKAKQVAQSVPSLVSDSVSSIDPSSSNSSSFQYSDSASSVGGFIDSHLVMDAPGGNHEAENIPPNANGDRNNANADRNHQDRRTIRDLTTSSENYDPFHSCPAFNINFELKGLFLSNLPKFHGLAGEDPYKHLKAMYVVCNSMKPHGTDMDEVFRQVFYFTLEGKAKEWFMMLPHHASTALASWNNLRNAFLNKYFPASRTASLTKDIYSAKQAVTESFYEFWNRFQELISKCPHHQIPEARLVQYFHSGLLAQDRNTVDSAAGGSIQDLTPDEAWALIEKIANNSQQFEGLDTRQLHEVSKGPTDMNT